tara:strand:+ start:389 stop:607 length:219 start_codon:yes stop_codon:yes gene_type:complete
MEVKKLMNKKKKSDLTFKKIENIRSKNNKNWMDILKIAYDSNPKKTSSVLKRILSKDRKLISLANSLSKMKK